MYTFLWVARPHPQQEVLLQEDVLPAVQREVDQRARPSGWQVDRREVTRRRRREKENGKEKTKQRKIKRRKKRRIGMGKNGLSRGIEEKEENKENKATGRKIRRT